MYWTLGKSLKPLATIILPKYPTFLGNCCKGVKIYHFCSEIFLGQLLWTFVNFLLVTQTYTLNLAIFRKIKLDIFCFDYLNSLE